MHGRIFQLSDTNPIDYLITSEDIPTDFYYGWTRVDYVIEDTNRQKSIEWLRDVIQGSALGNDDSITFPSDKRPYFEERFQKFKGAVDELYLVSLKEFSTKTYLSAMFSLEESFSEKGGFYIATYHGVDDIEIRTLQDWLREEDTSKTYYVGSVLDYRY